MRHTLLTLSLICLPSAVFAQLIHSVQDPYAHSNTLSPGDLAVITADYNMGGTGTPVTVGGKTAYVLDSNNGGTQMTIEIPVDAPTGPVTVQVGAAASSSTFNTSVFLYSPQIFLGTNGSINSPAHQATGAAITTAAPALPNEKVTLLAIGMGKTNPPVATGVVSPNPGPVVTGLLNVNVGGTNATGVTASLVPGLLAIYQVTFVMPTGLPAANSNVTLTVGGMVSVIIKMAVGGGAVSSVPAITSITDLTGNSTKLAPGGYAVINGTSIGQNPGVTVGGKTAYVLTPPNNGSSMTIQIPVDAPLGANQVILTTGSGGPSAPFSITLVQFAPMILLTESGGNTISPRHAISGALVTAASPASPGETIALFAAGLGPTIPQVATGSTPSPSALPPTATLPSVTVGGLAATGVTAVAASQQAGAYFVTFVVPANVASGSPAIQLSMGGAASNTLALPVFTGPLITSVANNYSYIVENLPNFGIAQGSIFDIFGSNLANTATGLQSVPLKTSLQGVTVSVTVNGTTTPCLLYYVTPNQIAAILPSATPVGAGTVIVNNNGQTSATAFIRVLRSAFGILTLNGLGDGQAAAFDVSNKYLSFTNALNPGDYFILWGTGVGAVSGDESVTQTPADLTNVPFTIEVGGVPAQLYYHGRSAYPGLDQVIGIVPAGVTPGCYVTVDTFSGNIVSNFATIPVAASGRNCSEPTVGAASGQWGPALGKSALNFALFGLSKSTFTFPATNPGGTPQSFITDKATAQFLNIPTTGFVAAVFNNPSLGSCQVYGFSGSQDPGAPNALSVTPLSAGAAVNITGPNGKMPLNYQPDKQKYSAIVGGVTNSGSNLPIFIPTTGGSFTFDDGAGGPDVGAFTGNLVLGSPLLNWTNQATISSVSRANGVTVSWTGGSAGGFVQIIGTSYTTGAGAVGATFICAAPLAAGQFTVPPSVLLSLPVSASNAVTPSASALTVAQVVNGQLSGASSNLDVSVIQSNIQAGIPVQYQ